MLRFATGNAEFLLGHVRGAIEAMAGGAGYKAGDGSDMWGVCDQKIGGRQTGRIIVGCTDTAALEELKTTLQRLGHTVERGRNLKTEEEVPNVLLVTPAR